MPSVTITDIPKNIQISGNVSYQDFLQQAFGEKEIFELDVQVHEYSSLSKQEQQEIDYIASLDASRFVNM